MTMFGRTQARVAMSARVRIRPEPAERGERLCAHCICCGVRASRLCEVVKRRRYVHRAFTTQPWPRDTCVNRAGRDYSRSYR